MKKIKKSIDFSQDSYMRLERYKEINEGSDSKIVNSLILTFIDLDPIIQKSIVKYCQSELRNLRKKIDSQLSVSYERYENQKLEEQFRNLIKFFNTGSPINLDELNKIEIKDGYALIPKFWVEIPLNKNQESKYVGILEVNHHVTRLSYFFFFSQKPVSQLKDREVNDLKNKVSKDFENLNSVKCFSIPEYDYESHLFYPFGAMIVRNSLGH